MPRGLGGLVPIRIILGDIRICEKALQSCSAPSLHATQARQNRLLYRMGLLKLPRRRYSLRRELRD
ncbi:MULTISPECIES: hypothetical protein [unclassified Bradyrhizobium]